ncbi:unnamed protein product [Mycena citricolor]|uniref:Cytochrome P450 n=1 Tax=Mycena citricolor TaxID=2018698 RepID=A0AAD2JUC4_9AGAR|nr:unnamed protein product [Mycena citricolor]
MQVLSKCSFGLGQGWTDIRLSLSAVGGISGPECSRSPSSLPRQQSAMPSIPPGIRYISKHLPRLLSPALLTYASIHVLQAFDIQLPFPSWIACLLSGPLVLTLIVQRRDWLDARAAAKNGATMGPVLPGWIGGVQMFFVKMIDMYPAEGMSIVLAKDAYTTRVRLLFQNRTITADPHNIKTVLATEFNSFEKGSEFQEVLGPLLGTGVFAADGDMWKFHRAMTRPFFHRERISDFELFDHHAENAIGQFKARLREGHPADFQVMLPLHWARTRTASGLTPAQDMVSRFTMDAATTFLFGTNVNTLEAGLPYPFYAPAAEPAAAGKSHPSSAFAAAFQQAQIIASARNRLGEHWPLQEFWVDTMEEPMSVVRAYLDPILREAIEKKRRSGSFEKADVNGDREVQEGETLLEHLVNYTEDHTILRDEILNITTAGRDTTACLLTFTVYMLAEHPEVLSKLRQEIMDSVGSTRAPTFDDFRTMKYLRAVLNETLRLYPPVPFNVRTACRPALFRSSPDGPPIHVPIGTRVVFTPIVMHRRKDLWGPDALKFDPARFLDERVHKYLTPNPFIFLPFNAGPRICLGQQVGHLSVSGKDVPGTEKYSPQFAYHEASFFLVRLLQSFSEISLAPAAQPPATRPPASWKTDDESGWKKEEKIWPRSHLTLYVNGGLWVTMREAEADKAAAGTSGSS